MSRQLMAAGVSSTPNITDQSSATQPRGRRVLVDTACDNCRARKVRCDGRRPTCGKCASKNVSCFYDTEPGETRVGSLKQKHTTLKEQHQELLALIERLRTAPMTEVDELIARLRSGSEPHVLHARLHTFEPQAHPTRSPPYLVTSENRRDHIRDTSNSSGNSCDNRPVVGSSQTRQRDLVTPEKTPSNNREPGNSGGSSIDCRQFTDHPQVYQHVSNQGLSRTPLSLPSRDVFLLALTVYNETVGNLFHVYTPQQASELFVDVFGEGNSSLTGGGPLCQLCAITALASFYHGDLPMEGTQDLYRISKDLLGGFLENDMYQGMKVCAILGMINILTKSTKTMVFLDLGLSMAQNIGIQDHRPPANMSRLQWLDCKRVWRTLLLLSGWIGSTLGIPSHMNWQASQHASSRMDFEDDSLFSDVIQREMAKIATLKANILRTITTFQYLAPGVIATIRADLQGWQDQLPPVMRITNLQKAGIDTRFEHRVCYVHLLYLGAVMLSSRCIMSNWMTNEFGSPAMLDLSVEAVACLNDGYISAGRSAHILGFLKDQGGAVRRCWICIFQSYISGLLLIQESYLRLLQGRETQVGLDGQIALIGKSVDMLTFCAAEDVVAAHLLQSLTVYYDDIQGVSATGVGLYIGKYGRDGYNQGSSEFVEYVSMIHGGVPSSYESPRSLLKLLSQPFADVSDLPMSGTKDVWSSLMDLIAPEANADMCMSSGTGAFGGMVTENQHRFTASVKRGLSPPRFARVHEYARPSMSTLTGSFEALSRNRDKRSNTSISEGNY